MDTIRNYVDMMFKDLPKTKEVIDMKLNILDNMEDRYNELLAEGKTENEAIGAVISQFGNIDELKEELGISSTTHHPSCSGRNSHNSFEKRGRSACLSTL